MAIPVMKRIRKGKAKKKLKIDKKPEVTKKSFKAMLTRRRKQKKQTTSGAGKLVLF